MNTQHHNATTQEATQMKAYLYRAPKALHKDGKKQQLLIGTNAQDIKHTFIVKGVKEANQIAKQYNAQRWNY